MNEPLTIDVTRGQITRPPDSHLLALLKQWNAETEVKLEDVEERIAGDTYEYAKLCHENGWDDLRFNDVKWE